MNKTLAYYRRLPYRRRAQLQLENGEHFWHAWVEELPGCEVDARSKAAAHAALAEAFEDYIAAKLEWNSVIPEPTRWPNLRKPRRGKAARATIKVLHAQPAKTVGNQLPTVANQLPQDSPLTAETLVGV